MKKKNLSGDPPASGFGSFHTDLPAGVDTLQIKNLKFTLTKKIEIIR